MTSSSWDRSRHVTAAASILMVIAVAAGVLVLALGTSMPEPWWPHTGQAFATNAHSSHQDPCDRIVGPAKEYCERGTTNSAPASTGHRGAAGAAWRLVTAGAGLTVLVVWRHRSAPRQGRR
ncbi:hypothetical protein OOK58_50975 [Streptomyces sp. NBC_01728]|jgi:hypothetical protein|uniref:hypothetical protein n=1 Tax=unclassified Streptomyces TaxID=2593676 RepID=UPI00225AE0F1|nr:MULTISPECIES: hypothetical protein [unclassified Streptomyces]MCX4462511.1 hypothetical protein [Streptomyces sp. NBC_01719]MCX4490071.1 hypothetical protein [Streptomyces sp. NBC_01728]MCX4499478.1 hypothetical protein [Streptomyces sp. NBC_01728]